MQVGRTSQQPAPKDAAGLQGPWAGQWLV